MKITWFGHSAFRLDFADKVVLIDPFFTGNPAFEGSREKASEGVTHILITHGHGDHVGDTVDHRRRRRAPRSSRMPILPACSGRRGLTASIP